MTKTKKLWLAWGILFLICALCGFFSAPGGALYGLLFLLGISFFVPPVMLTFEALHRQDRKTLVLIRNLSLLSLGLTLLLIVLNFLTVQASNAWGVVLYWLLVLVSTPMVCTQVWVVSLFGWAFLLISSLTYLKKQ